MNWPWVWLLIAAIPLLGFLLLRKGTDRAAAAPPAQPPEAMREGPIVTYSGSDEPGSATLTSLAEPTAPMAETAPDNLDPSMISAVRERAGREEIIFHDGSTMLMDDFTYRQLPEDVRFRLDYAREEE